MHASQALVLAVGIAAFPIGVLLLKLGQRWRTEMLEDPSFPRGDLVTMLSYFGPARFTIILGYAAAVLGVVLAVGAIIGAFFLALGVLNADRYRDGLCLAKTAGSPGGLHQIL